VSIVYGADDRFVYDADEFYGAYANAFAPPASVLRVEGAAHRVDEERPRVIVSEVQRLLAEEPA
jgi:pimeloyl-ACP methyl ester carboxylesterase